MQTLSTQNNRIKHHVDHPDVVIEAERIANQKEEKKGLFGKKGFTLMEILVVLVIIGGLLLTVMPSLSSGDKTSALTLAANIRAIEKAKTEYFFENNTTAGITVATLISGKHLKGGFDAAQANPFGGAIVVSAVSSDRTKAQVVVPGMTAADVADVKKGLNSVYDTDSLDVAKKEWTLTL